eukprot:EG_transcript_1185
MRLGVIFVITLAVSVILSSTATWALTYTTSYVELRAMSTGFVELSTVALGDFGQLVRQLISDSGTLVAGILDAEYARSMAQLNETGLQFLQATMDLMARAKNATAQAQGLVAALVVSFGGFIQSVITDFESVATDYASRLRLESASRTQDAFHSTLRDSILAIQMVPRLYDLGLLDFSRLPDQPIDEGSCTVMASLCTISAELGVNVYIGSAGGTSIWCDVNEQAYQLSIRRGTTADNVTFIRWPPFTSDSTANLTQWKQSCLADRSGNSAFMDVSCPHSGMMQYPNQCNMTCGYDPRCRLWYSRQVGSTTAKTMMSDVYIDVQKGIPVVSLSYPIFSGVSGGLVAVAATDLSFSDVDAHLSTLPTMGVSQVVAVIFNSSDLLVVGTSRPCRNTTEPSSGKPVTTVCDPALRRLGKWLQQNQGLTHNVTLDLNGTLWDVFPGTVDTFGYFVAVGMNKSEVYAVITATNQAAHDTLQTISQQQSIRMAALEAAALAEMDAVAAEKVASLQAMQAELTQHSKDVHAKTAATFNASREQSAADLRQLINDELVAVRELEDYHVSQIVRAVGVTFGAVVGIFAAILLLGGYGTWAVTKQVQRIAQVMEDVAHMRVEELQVTQKSSVNEVRRIEAALGVLVRRLAEYKSYMPAGLFQPENMQLQSCPSAMLQQKDRGLRGDGPGSGERRPTVGSDSATSCATAVQVAPLSTFTTRLLRRSVAAMVVNVIHFQAEVAQRSAVHLEGMMNRFISTVHSLASKAQGNIDAVVGDQLLVTFNAHFTCSDPPIAASSVALELLGIMKGSSAPCEQVQVGLAAGPMYAGHVGYAPFKSMLALGAPMKVASLLSHLSGFDASAVLACPSVEERIKYHFTLQPVDLVALPAMGEHIHLYARSISVFLLEAQAAGSRGAQEWLYEVAAGESKGHWAAAFQEVVKARSTDQAREELEGYLGQHPDDWVARRLLGRLAHWQPRVGVVLAERPDTDREARPSSMLHSPPCSP